MKHSERLAPNDAAIVQEFTRIRSELQTSVLQVLEISWNGPHTRVGQWTAVKAWSPDPPDTEREVWRWRILQDHRYFRVCRECSERNPVGWMHDRDTCDRCAEANHGIIH